MQNDSKDPDKLGMERAPPHDPIVNYADDQTKTKRRIFGPGLVSIVLCALQLPWDALTGLMLFGGLFGPFMEGPGHFNRLAFGCFITFPSVIALLLGGFAFVWPASRADRICGSIGFVTSFAWLMVLIWATLNASF